MSSQFRSPKNLRALYTVLSPLYDRLVPAISSDARTLGAEVLGVEDGERVLDLGCGTGIALQAIAQTNPTGETVGIDATPAMVKRAKRRLGETPSENDGVNVGLATNLPYPADSFDAAFSSYVLDVLPASAVRPTLRELSRVLKPSGRIVLVYLAPPKRPVERFWSFLGTYAPFLLGGSRPVRLQHAIRESGYVIEASQTCTQLGLRSRIVRASLR